MSELWLGASLEVAECIFLLPNKPILPNDNDAFLAETNNVPLLIELNGNHWRKIFTIMAKLMVVEGGHWRDFRDSDLLSKIGIAFSTRQLIGYNGLVFVVGNTFRDVLPISDVAKVIGDKYFAYGSPFYVWCPYLDYRQFPNVLIESLREYLLEKKCLKS